MSTPRTLTTSPVSIACASSALWCDSSCGVGWGMFSVPGCVVSSPAQAPVIDKQSNNTQHKPACITHPEEHRVALHVRDEGLRVRQRVGRQVTEGAQAPRPAAAGRRCAAAIAPAVAPTGGLGGVLGLGSGCECGWGVRFGEGKRHRAWGGPGGGGDAPRRA